MTPNPLNWSGDSDEAKTSSSRLVDRASMQDAHTQKYVNTATLYATLIRSGVISGGDSDFYFSILRPKLEWMQSKSGGSLTEKERQNRLDLIDAQLGMVARYYGDQAMKRSCGILEWSFKGSDNFEKTIEAVKQLVVFSDSLRDLQEHALEIRSTLEELGVPVEEGEEFVRVHQQEFNVVHTNRDEDESSRTKSEDAKVTTSQSIAGALRMKFGGGGVLKGLQRLIGMDVEAEASVEAKAEAEQSVQWGHEGKHTRTQSHDVENKHNTSTEMRTSVDPVLMTYGMTNMLAVAAIMKVKPSDFRMYRETFRAVNSKDPIESASARRRLRADRDELTKVSESLTELADYLKTSRDTVSFLGKYLSASDVQEFAESVQAGEFISAYNFLKTREHHFKTTDAQGHIASPKAGTERLEGIKAMLLTAGVVDNFIMDWRQAERYSSEMSGVLQLYQNNKLRDKPVISSFMNEEDIQPYLGWTMDVHHHYGEDGQGFYGVSLSPPESDVCVIGVCSEIPSILPGKSYVLDFDARSERMKLLDESSLKDAKDFDDIIMNDTMNSLRKMGKTTASVLTSAPPQNILSN